MLKLIEAVAPGQLAPLDHVKPSPPEKFGYKRLHRAKYFALKAKTASLNAFQRMLAYCSYSVAGAPEPQLGSVREECRSLLLHPEKLNHVFNHIGAGAPNTEIHVLVKFLWATLGEIRRASNFVGIVVHHHKGYDYPSVRAMYRYGVPVYVSWDVALRVKSYSSYSQHHLLDPWLPSGEAVKALGRPLPPPFTTDPIQTPAPTPSTPSPPLKSTNRFLDPMDYVRGRKLDIEAKLSRADRKQSMMDRQISAMKFGARSERGPPVFEFERKEEIDRSTGRKMVYWERVRLDSDPASTTYELASSRQLWCVVFSLLFSLLNSRSGTTVTLTSGTSVRSSTS